MKNIFFIIIILFCSACSSDDNSDQMIVDTSINLSIRDSEGNDLLDPQTDNSYKESEIKLFYLKNGEEMEIFNSNLDYPKGFFIYKQENEFRMRIFPHTEMGEKFPTTYIKWNNSDIDTVKCNIEKTTSSEICTKVWFNNNIVWEAYETERFFKIIK